MAGHKTHPRSSFGTLFGRGLGARHVNATNASAFPNCFPAGFCVSSLFAIGLLAGVSSND